MASAVSGTMTAPRISPKTNDRPLKTYFASEYPHMVASSAAPTELTTA